MVPTNNSLLRYPSTSQTLVTTMQVRPKWPIPIKLNWRLISSPQAPFLVPTSFFDPFLHHWSPLPFLKAPYWIKPRSLLKKVLLSHPLLPTHMIYALIVVVWVQVSVVAIIHPKQVPKQVHQKKIPQKNLLLVSVKGKATDPNHPSNAKVMNFLTVRPALSITPHHY